jgi:hypothetical protein
MTDIRDRLADALREELHARDDGFGVHSAWISDHLVPLLLSLPGIAIVDTNTDIEWVADQMAKADDIIYGLLTPDEAEYYQRLARAALLAAANSAEAAQ